jgi:hypothetical protein
MFGKLLFGIATLLLLLSLGLSKVNAQPDVVSIVVPNANEFVEGNIGSSFPFNEPSPMRYQQLYSSTQFAGCGKIIQVKFRYDGFRTGGSVTYPDILIQLSTTTVTAGTISTTFAANIGPNVITVYDGELSFSAPTCSGEPCPFNNTITLQTPFNYNPNNGNLLLDITKQDSPSYVLFDAVDDEPFITLSVFNNGNANAETGQLDSDGLVTQFVCEPVVTNVPTLSEWGLISLAVVLGIMGIVGFMVMRRRKVTA